MSTVMMIDGLNMFIRSYIVNPTMDKHGNPIGGCIGFLKSLQKTCNEFNPDEVIVCWDGHGGSQKRKELNKNYKLGRAPIRFNRRLIDLPPEKQEENKAYQLIRLMEYLNELPIIQLVIDFVEADDIIAFGARNIKYDGWNKIIVSSDKDFFQLIDDRIKVWSPGSKKEWSISTVIERFGIHPENFCLAKCFAGDASDGIKGVPGVGFKSLAKRFPDLSLEGSLDINDIVTECKKLQVQRSLKLYDNIIEHEDQIRKNWKLMYLGHGKLAASQVEKIDHMIKQLPQRDKLGFIKALLRLQITGVDYDRLFMTLKTLK